MKRIFITGSSGFIGSRAVERLEGETLYKFHRGEDVMESLKSFKPTHILHLAGEIYDNTKMFESNIYLTFRILKYAAKYDIDSMVYIGSSSEYGKKDKPMAETDVLEPRTLYEATKGCGTLLCQSFAREYKVPVSIARPFSVYGKGEPRHRLIPKLILCANTGMEINISPGNHDFIHIDDFLNGVFMLLFEKQLYGQVVNFGTGTQHTNEQVSRMVEKIAKKPINRTLIRERLRKYDSDYWVADISKAKSMGWFPNYTLEEGLKTLIK